ncbi:phosphatidylglycerophosphatase A family protein [Thermochromatium tepidum]|uniref:Phosphatidylglycerophosphatase A n=1 Tax=Thermochromatium tepidum ATCC 43061 TaxID=316276 RepID=A0A6I6EA42_THETI|nr:phosphatidylglycerophosphatase A [Thermochromatium tepidum]QGU31809.1 phosphatidylglycerophosphatase A [Thermochromatium tepidum ATCC 43061]
MPKIRDSNFQCPTGFDRRKLHHWIAFGFGSGLAPKAPGTFGTLAAIPIYLLMSPLAWPYYLGLVILFSLIGIWACDRTARELDAKDPAAIVWDEFVGFFITMLVVPYSLLMSAQGWVWVLAGVLAFRLFDIWKPWPIQVIDERVGGGLGIMLDDILAGIMAALTLLVLQRLLTS